MPRTARPAAVIAVALATSLVAACDPIEGNDIYAAPGDGPVVCGFNIQHTAATAFDLEPGLDRAAQGGTIVQYYAHRVRPEGPFRTSRLESLLVATAERGMDFVTYAEMAQDRAAGGSLALSFDDTNIDDWYALRPLFKRYRARATFFVTRFHTVDEDHRRMLTELAADGHDIEYHGANHKPSARYVDDHGMEGFLHDEIDSDLAEMRAAGFSPTVFAYPFSERRSDIDAALTQRFALLRAGAYYCP